MISNQLLVIAHSSSAILATLKRALGAEHEYIYESTPWGTQLFDRLPKCRARLIVAEAMTPCAEVIQVLKWLREHPISTPILTILPTGADEQILELVFQVASDFLLAPVHQVELAARVARIVGGDGSELEEAHNRLTEAMGIGQLIGSDPAFVSMVKMIPVIARSGLPVLITGETGTGKELCARAIHHLSQRRHAPFIAMDCGAIPDHLFENELFGHVRGAYTDAHADQKGLIALAQGGTLLLDEIDALSLGAQAKLLRFLQERTYRPLGAERFVQADVNIIAATNREIEDCVRDRQIRADLYFRLNVARLKLPPLRERRGDIGPLARHFLRLQPVSFDAANKTFLPATLHKLALYDWPGNVRELINVVQRAALFAEGQYILPEHVPLSVADSAELVDSVDEGFVEDFRHARAKAIETFEKRYIGDLLRKHQGNVTRAALEAGKDRRAFGRLKKKYQINS